MKKSVRAQGVEGTRERGSGLGVGNGLLCSFLMARHELREEDEHILG